MNHPVVLIALQEFTLNRRNRWVTSFAVLFALLTFFIAYFGMVTAGYSGFQDFARTSTSLISLTGFLVPLFALMLTVFSFISNPEYLEMMVAQPVSRRQVVAGKYLGLVLTLLAATLLGFSVPGILISLVVGVEGALLAGIGDPEPHPLAHQPPGVTHLSARLGVEGGVIQIDHPLLTRTQPLCLPTVVEDRLHRDEIGQPVVAGEFGLPLQLDRAALVDAEVAGGACPSPLPLFRK